MLGNVQRELRGEVSTGHVAEKGGKKGSGKGVVTKPTRGKIKGARKGSKIMGQSTNRKSGKKILQKR